MMVEEAQRELEAYKFLFEQYKEWRETVCTVPYVDPKNLEFRQKFSEHLFLIADLTEEEFDELEEDYQHYCR